GGMLLEEALPLGAVRTAHQRERAADDVRSHPVPDGAIVVGEILLGHADINPVDAIRMGETDVAFPPRLGGACRWHRSACHRLGRARHRLSGTLRLLVRFFGHHVHASAMTFPDRDPGTFAGNSRVTSRAGLSSRMPLNAAWRTRPSAVQPRRFASITVAGLTQ